MFSLETFSLSIRWIRHAGCSRRATLAVAALGGCFHAAAQISYSSQGTAVAGVGYLFGPGVPDVNDQSVVGSTTPTSLSGSATKSGDGFLVSGNSTATFGLFGNAGGMFVGGAASVQNQLSPVNVSLAGGNMTGTQTLVVDDLIFEGLGPTVTTSLNFLFSTTGTVNGSPGAAHIPTGSSSASGSWGSTVKISFEGIQTDIGTFGYEIQRFAGPFAPATQLDNHATGLLAGYSAGASLLKSSSVEVPTGVPIRLTIELNAQTAAGNVDAGSSDSTVEATLGFPTVAGAGSGAGVFDLPNGYTVHSDAWGLHNNSLAGGGGAVPEPEETALVVGLGLGGFVAWRRRRQTGK